MAAGRPKPLAVTMGEPGGIAPDITVKAWLRLRSGFERSFFVIGDVDLMKSRAKMMGEHIGFASIERPEQATELFAEALPVLPHPTARVSPPGLEFTFREPLDALPFFNPDVEEAGLPRPVERWRSEVRDLAARARNR